VVGESLKKLPSGQPGEILVRGFNVMKGYFSDEDATRSTIDPSGWLHTGDIGILGEDGNLRITDRKKDMFICGGFNVYPAEVEGIIAGHPSVAQVSVIGVPDERMGEIGLAFVILRRDEPWDPDAFLGWCRDNMANYKAPRSVQVVESLPLNPSGKVMKFRLRARAAASGASPSATEGAG
jgi:acyl-CoA synthetase (AMP-forming)/AMP-acid ligase II